VLQLILLLFSLLFSSKRLLDNLVFPLETDNYIGGIVSSPTTTVCTFKKFVDNYRLDYIDSREIYGNEIKFWE
jgi:hypothetical protein